MKIRKLLPLTALVSIVPCVTMPLSSCSCNQYRFISLLKGFTPDSEPIAEHQFDSIQEVCDLYVKLDKKILAQDYIWSLGEYVKEDLEFPQPLLPFKFSSINIANITLEDWWSQTSDIPNTFLTTFSSVIQISGKTEPRNGYSYPNSYIPNSMCVIYLMIQANKVPFTIKNKHVPTSNVTDATWIIQPAADEILLANKNWSISVTTTVTYSIKSENNQSITSIDELGVYWSKDKIYDPVKDPQISYLYSFVYDSMVYGSYHLKNCTLKN